MVCCNKRLNVLSGFYFTRRFTQGRSTPGRLQQRLLVTIALIILITDYIYHFPLISFEIGNHHIYNIRANFQLS